MRTLPAALLLLTACDGNDLDGLWVLEVGDPVYDADVSTCEENFLDASCGGQEAPDEDDPWTRINESSSNPGLTTAEVFEGPGRDLWLVWDDVLLPLTRKGNTLSGTWTGTTESKDERRHEDGYAYTHTSTATVEITATLTRSKEDRHAWEGEVVQHTVSDRAWTESDTWEGAPEVPSTGEIFNGFSHRLEADEEPVEDDEIEEVDVRWNRSDAEDCEGDLCRGRLTSESTVRVPVTGWPTEGERDPGAGTYGELETPSGGDWGLGGL